MDHAGELTSPLPLSANTHTSHPPARRIYLGKAPVDSVSMQQSSEWLRDHLSHRPAHATPLQVMGPNAALVSLAQNNTSFASALARASLCLPDGMSTVWAGRLLGAHMPERVPGGEFMERMCALCAASGLSVYFLGGLPGSAEGAAQNLTQRYPGLIVAGIDCPPFQFELNPEANALVCARIADARPDLLFVALGAPRQEIWMHNHCPTLPIGAALSVGAAFDTQAGLRKRAPAWTHNIGLEWAYRFAMEPQRLWRRYLLGNLHFIAITITAWVRLKTRRSRAA